MNFQSQATMMAFLRTFDEFSVPGIEASMMAFSKDFDEVSVEGVHYT